GDVPSVPSAIAKYHCTTMGREVAADFMDTVGGNGIILGPRNIGGRACQVAPIAITVEGAHIMTRRLLVIAQAAVLCHPSLLQDTTAAQDPDHAAGSREFDRTLFGHIGFAISNAVRSFWFGTPGAKIGKAPGDDYTRRYFRKLDRYSANLALM